MPAPSQKAREYTRTERAGLIHDDISERTAALYLDLFTLELREALREAILEVEHLNESETVKTQAWRSVADAYSPEEEKG